MIAKELQYRFEHYALLLVILSAFIAAFYIAPTHVSRVGLSLLLAGVYFCWGMWSHRHEIRTTRLVLEYLSVGLLGSAILIVLSRSL